MFLGDAALVFGQAVRVGRYQKKTAFVGVKAVAADGVGLVFDFHLEVPQIEGLFGNPDYVENLLRLNPVVVVIGAPKLKGDDFFRADSSSTVDVMLARFSDFGDVKVRGDVLAVGQDEGYFFELTERVLEFL